MGILIVDECVDAKLITCSKNTSKTSTTWIPERAFWSVEKLKAVIKIFFYFIKNEKIRHPSD